MHCWHQTQVIHCKIVRIFSAVQLADSFGSVRADWRHNFWSQHHLHSSWIFSLNPIDCDVGWVSPKYRPVYFRLFFRYAGFKKSFVLYFATPVPPVLKEKMQQGDEDQRCREKLVSAQRLKNWTLKSLHAFQSTLLSFHLWWYLPGHKSIWKQVLLTFWRFFVNFCTLYQKIQLVE